MEQINHSTEIFRELPVAKHDIAATSNQPRITGWINLGGKRGPLTGVDSIGIRMRAPIDNPTIELRSIALSKDDPGDRYLENKPAFDKFGQWNLGDYEGKIYSEEQLQKNGCKKKPKLTKQKISTIPVMEAI